MIRAVVAVALVAIAVPGGAEERMPGKAVAVNYVKFKPGTTDRVDEIERKYFDPASEKVGNRPIVIRMASGEWDREYIFPLRGGMAQLDFRTSKEDEAFEAEIDRLAGGAGMAKKLLAEWGAAVERQKTEFGFSDQK